MDDDTAFRAWCAHAMQHAEELDQDPSYEATITGGTLLRLLESAARVWDEDERISAALVLHERVSLPTHHEGSAPDVCRTCWDQRRGGFATWPCPTVLALSPGERGDA